MSNNHKKAPDKLIIGLAGAMASGKGTAAEYLKNKYHAATYRFSTMLSDALDRFYLERNRDNFVKISEIIRGTFGEDIMAKTMAKDVEKDTNTIIVVEGVRRLADTKYLRKLEGFVLAEISADIKTRYKRLTQRSEKTDDKTKTFAEFKADHKRSTELSILAVAKQATEKIDNNGDLARLCQQLDKLVKKYRHDS